MSKPAEKIDFKTLRLAHQAKQALMKKAGGIVNVPQAQAAFVPHAHALVHPYIATRGLGPCVGLVVDGERGVFFAHIDSTSDPFARRIAGVALGFVGKLRSIWISTSSQVLPVVDAQGQPARPWRNDFAAERIYRQLMGIFIDFPEVQVQTLGEADVMYSFATRQVSRSAPYSAGIHDRKPGVRYLSLLSQDLPTLQWPE
jgi:hypothetical protein